MDYPLAIIFTPLNYKDWKANTAILMRSKGLYRVNLASENESNAVIEKAKWNNRLDESYRFIFLTIYLDLLFHIDGFTTPNQVWTKLIEVLFEFQEELRTHQLDIDLFSMNTSSFNSIRGLFTKFKLLVLSIKHCGIKKKYD